MATNNKRPTARPAQRGSEHVAPEDRSSTAHQATTNKWDRVPGAIAYLASYVVHLAETVENKDKLDPVSAVKLMDQLYNLKEMIAERIKSPTEKAYDMARFTIVPELMANADMTAVSVDGIGRCNLQDDINASVAKENKEAFQQWLIDNELEDMITRSVNAQTLAAWVRKRIKDPKLGELPTELIKITPFTRAVITRT